MRPHSGLMRRSRTICEAGATLADERAMPSRSAGNVVPKDPEV